MGFEKKEKRFAVERQQELERMPADQRLLEECVDMLRKPFRDYLMTRVETKIRNACPNCPDEALLDLLTGMADYVDFEEDVESEEDDRAHDDLEQQNEMRYQGLIKQIRQHLPLMGWNSNASDCIR
jgi:hypothetical protein